jgi:hypothetical protein
MGTLSKDVKLASLGGLLVVKFKSENCKKKYIEIKDVEEVDITTLDKFAGVSERAVKGLINKCLNTSGCLVLLDHHSSLIFRFKSKTRQIDKKLNELTMPQIILLRILLEE